VSLRDQLLKAGVATRDQVRAAERRLKEERRQQQAQRISRRDEDLRQQEEAQRLQQARLDERRRARAERQELEEALARRLRANQIVGHHALRFGPGVQPFWHPSPASPALHRLDLPRKLALELRAGRAAVVWEDATGEPTFHVVLRPVAERLLSVLPERLLFWNRTPPDPSDPAEQLLEPRGER
jgi:uncharacterized protein YaiL (DUF2058 family)